MRVNLLMANVTQTSVCAFLAAALLAGTALASTPRFARLGSFDGPVEVQFDAADAWRPGTLNLPLAEGTRIRTGSGATVEIELDDTSAFRMVGEGLAELSDYARLSGGQRITVISLDHGLAYFTGEASAANAIHLLVPGAQASLREGSRLRLQALQEWSEIAIIEGAAQFTIPSAEMELRQGQSARVTVPESTHFSLFREIAPLEPDSWSEALDKAETDAPASRLDLDRAGKWIKAADYGTVWQPVPQAGWAPFRDGRWIWYQSVGFTWVGGESWGWTPYHEGRWLQHSDLGWVWVPPAEESTEGDHFLPGEVFWARAGNLAAWGPLAPGESWPEGGTPRQFAALNTTGGAFVSGAREIVPSSAENLPKDLLKSFLFTSALPSPPLPVTRLTAVREPLRTRIFSAVEVTPDVQPMTQAAPPPPDVTPVVAEVAPPPPLPMQAVDPDPAVPDTPAPPIVPGIVVITSPRKASTASSNTIAKASATKTSSVSASTDRYVAPFVPNFAALTGAGARDPELLFQRWFQEYGQAQITYQAAGTHQGLIQLGQGKIDFAASDTPLSDAQIGDTRLPVFLFPTAIGAVVPIYNVPGIYDGLKLTPEAIAGIYLGEIRYWNDSRIVAVNPRAGLPHTPIVLVARSDGSAATYTWTDYLSKISPVWKAKQGAATSINWPVAGLAAKGDGGVAEAVSQTPYSLSYMDYAWAVKNNVLYAAVRNRSGSFVLADSRSLTEAAARSVQAPTDFRASITDAPGSESYPIASFTYLIVPQKISDQQKRTSLTVFLTWMTADGQKAAAGSGLGPLPQEVVAGERRQIRRMN